MFLESFHLINEDFIVENRRPSIEITQIDEEKNLGSKKIQKINCPLGNDMKNPLFGLIEKGTFICSDGQMNFLKGGHIL